MKAPQDFNLLVIDEPEAGARIVLDLLQMGYRAFTIPDEGDAFPIIEKMRVDLLISGKNSLGGAGLGLLDQIKEKNIHFPVFIFLDENRALSPEEAYARGAEAVFRKPIVGKELFSALNYALLPIQERFHRKDFRVDVEMPVGIRFQKSNFITQSKILNLGRGGMFVALEDRFPEVSEVAEFNVEETPFTMLGFYGAGIVRWVRERASAAFLAGCGIEFRSLAQTNALEIINLIEKRKPKSFIPRK